MANSGCKPCIEGTEREADNRRELVLPLCSYGEAHFVLHVAETHGSSPNQRAFVDWSEFA